MKSLSISILRIMLLIIVTMGVFTIGSQATQINVKEYEYAEGQGPEIFGTSHKIETIQKDYQMTKTNIEVSKNNSTSIRVETLCASAGEYTDVLVKYTNGKQEILRFKATYNKNLDRETHNIEIGNTKTFSVDGNIMSIYYMDSGFNQSGINVSKTSNSKTSFIVDTRLVKENTKTKFRIIYKSCRRIQRTKT